MSIYKNEGLKGFTRGYSSMLVRDTFTWGIYFMIFDLAKRRLGVCEEDRLISYSGLPEH
jgi:hypothetical protein